MKDDGRHFQFLHTLDQHMSKLRDQIEALRLPKIEFETKLGLLFQTVESLPDPEIVKKELEEITEECRRKEHLFKTDVTMLRALDGVVEVK